MLGSEGGVGSTPEKADSAAPSAANAADILALGRAALDSIARALRSAPEVRDNRVMARWPVDLEDLLLELEPMAAETSISALAARMGISTAQLRSTVLRLQRLSLVKVSQDGVSLTATGRQKLARVEMSRAAVLRRIAAGLERLPAEQSRLLLGFLERLIDQSEAVADNHLGEGPADRLLPPRPARIGNS